MTVTTTKPAATKRAGAFKHAPWCAVRQALHCGPYGCRGEILASPIGATWLATGETKTPDIAVKTAAHALTPGQALELAANLTTHALVALGGEPKFDLDPEFVAQVCGFSPAEVADLVAVLLPLAALDAQGKPRPAHLRPRGNR